MTISVSYGRTISKDYQSERVDITLDVPDAWAESDVLQLCKYMVDAALGLKVDRRAANKLVRDYYHNNDVDIEDFALGK